MSDAFRSLKAPLVAPRMDIALRGPSIRIGHGGVISEPGG